MVKPGTFDPENFSELQTPGVSLFMQLPGPDQPMVAFRAMSDCARRLVERLGGRLQDETHSALTTQTLSHYEERVRSFIQHQARLAGGRRV
jgi:cell division protein ZipA